MNIEINRQKFILHVKELMRDHGEMSPSDLSRAVHCELHSVTKWLNGTFYPRYETLVALSDYFQTSVDFILGLTENDLSVRSANTIPFALRLKTILERQKKSRSSLAKELGVKTTTVSKWLEQSRMPEAVNLIKLAALFDVSVEYVTGLSNQEYISF